MTYKKIEKDTMEKIEVAIMENVKKYNNGVNTIAKYSYYDELLKVNSKKWTNSVRDLQELKKAIIECEQFLKDELLAYNNVELEGECEEGYPVWVEQTIEAKVLQPYQKLDEVPRKSIDKIIKNEIKKILSLEEKEEIDCKILNLFKDDVLDFETFKKISTAPKECVSDI